MVLAVDVHKKKLILESIFWNLDWGQMGISITGKFLNNLRFADDIVVILSDSEELELMLSQLIRVSKYVGLIPNFKKTKIMTDSMRKKIKCDQSTLEYVDDFILFRPTLII